MIRKYLSAVFVLLVMSGNAPGQTGPHTSITDGYTATRTGIRLHYLQSGQNDSTRALVLIPGWRLPAYLWDEQLRTFGQLTRVVAVDPRSQGESTKTTEGNSPESRAKDLHDVLANLRITRSVLVGWSQGAQDVAAYVNQFGTESVAGIVFVDSPASIGPAEVETHKEFSKVILSDIQSYAEHPDQYSRGMVESLFKQPPPGLDMKKLVDATLRTPTDIGIAMVVMDIFGADRDSPLAKLNTPALVIASASSPLLDLQKAMATRMPRAQFVVIEGTGHAVFVDRPSEFDGAIKAFLKSIDY